MCGKQVRRHGKNGSFHCLKGSKVISSPGKCEIIARTTKLRLPDAQPPEPPISMLQHEQVNQKRAGERFFRTRPAPLHMLLNIEKGGKGDYALRRRAKFSERLFRTYRKAVRDGRSCSCGHPSMHVHVMWFHVSALQRIRLEQG